MESRTYKPYTAPRIEVEDVVLESAVMQTSSIFSSIMDLDEDKDYFIW